MIGKPILRRISRYKATSSEELVSNFKFSERPIVFEQSLFTKQGASGNHEDLLYEITESHLDFSHMVRTKDLEQKLDLLVKERKNSLDIKRHNLPLSNKILLYGEPGCGKTLTAYCLAGELNKPLYIVNLGNIISSKLGETAQNLERIFRKAKDNGAILFLDEFDILSRDRGAVNEHGEIKRVVNVILQILDLLDEETIFIGATNQFKSLDKAIVRRFNYTIQYPTPSKEKIEEYVDFLSKSYHFSFRPTNLKDSFNSLFEGLSYADIKGVMISILKEKIFQQKSGNRSIRLGVADKERAKKKLES